MRADYRTREDGRNDAQLMSACARDPDTFRVLYDRYAKRVFGFFDRRTHDCEANLDMTVETFARAWQVLRLRSWLRFASSQQLSSVGTAAVAEMQLQR